MEFCNDILTVVRHRKCSIKDAFSLNSGLVFMVLQGHVFKEDTFTVMMGVEEWCLLGCCAVWLL
jgi:hypothetical protein